MKVLIACTVTPFADSPVQARARLLCERLVAAGHASEILRIPFAAAPAVQLPAQLAMMRAFDTWNVDHLLALDVPASLLRHPRKSLWLDAGLPLAPDADARLRALLGNAARAAVAESRAAFSADAGARRILRESLGLAVPVLPLPPHTVGAQAGQHILAAPPLDAGDTRLLAALALAAPGVRLLVAGKSAGAAQEDLLRDAARDLGVEARVRFDLRPLAGPELDGYLAAAVAVACIGGADDTALALAAAGAGKPAIAAAGDDCPGIVRPHLSGWLAPAQPAALAAVFDEAWHQRHRTLAYGARARDLLPLAGFDWPHTLDALLA